MSTRSNGKSFALAANARYFDVSSSFSSSSSSLCEMFLFSKTTKRAVSLHFLVVRKKTAHDTEHRQTSASNDDYKRCGGSYKERTPQIILHTMFDESASSQMCMRVKTVRTRCLGFYFPSFFTKTGLVAKNRRNAGADRLRRSRGRGTSASATCAGTDSQLKRALKAQKTGLAQEPLESQGSRGALMRKIAAHQITASDLNTFSNTFLINMRMKFVMTTTTKSDDDLITFELCEGRAEQHYHIPVRATRYTCVLGW